MIYAFTGPTHLTPEQLAYVQQTLRDMREFGGADEWRSGGAFGVDTEVALLAPPGKLRLVLPEGKWHNTHLVSIRGATVEYVQGGYRKRNEALVRGADVLHAFLKRDTFYRSGEWMTVNIAGRSGVPGIAKWLLPEGD